MTCRLELFIDCMSFKLLVFHCDLGVLIYVPFPGFYVIPSIYAQVIHLCSK
jgi:hypothetical protein